MLSVLGRIKWLTTIYLWMSWSHCGWKIRWVFAFAHFSQEVLAAIWHQQLKGKCKRDATNSFAAQKKKPFKDMSMVSKEWECVYTIANPEGKTNTEVQCIKRIRLTCQRVRIQQLIFCTADQCKVFDIKGILEAYFSFSCTDLKPNIQNWIKQDIMLTAFNSIQWKKRLQATFEEGNAGN